MSDDRDKRSIRLDDLANMAGVSISTVSRALNDSPAVNRVTKQRIWKLAREFDYPFRGTMPAGPSGAEATLAVVVPRPQARSTQLADPFLVSLIASIGEAARDRSCDLVLSHIAPTTFDDLLYAMDTNRADGVIFIGQGALHGALNRLISHDERFIVWGAELADQSYCSVGSDNRLGGSRAAQHLIRLGRRELVFLGDRSVPEALQRFHGFAEAHAQAGITLDEDRIIRCHFEAESAATAIHSAIASHLTFDAVVGASDLIALGALRALQSEGRSVPGDIAVVGYDDIPASRLSQPALTTISQDVALAGKLLVAKLLDTGGKPGASERTPTELIVRGTCGA